MEMALFTAASKHFVKSAGNSTLHYVPDLNSADRFNVLCLVKRKRSFWPWKKPKITPTMITLNDILASPIDTSKMISTLLVAEAYKDTPSFNANGDIGAKIAAELDIDLSMTDKFSLNVNFGCVMKTEVKWEALERDLASTAANGDHEIFKEIEQKKRTSLCVVLESLACKKEAPLDEISSTTEKGKVSGTTPKVTGVSVDVHMQGEVDQSKHHSYTIPPGTVIGFSCTKLDLNENGNLSMHIGVDKVDSIEAHILSPASKVEKMKEELAPLFDFKKLAEFRSILHGILETPQYIDNLLELVSTASVIIEDGRPFTMSIDHISSQLTGAKGWKEFLQMVGFKIPESASTASKIEFPTVDKDKLLQCSWAILESASELSEDEIKAFLQCDAKNKDQLLIVLMNAMNKKDTKYSEIGKMLDANGNEKKFLSSLGFQIMDGNDGKVLSFKWHSHPRDAFTLVYTLM